MSLQIGFVPSAARSTNSQSSAVQLPTNADNVSIQINVTANSGTLTPTVQWSNDNVNWASADPADAFTALTTVTNVVKSFPVKATLVRLAWTIATGATFSADIRWADHSG